MTNENSYQIAGYIEYLTEGPRFVTPIFRNKEDLLFIQFVDYDTQKTEYRTMDDFYIPYVKKDIDRATIIISDPNAPVFGFKWKEDIRFLSVAEMKAYLSTEILPLQIADALVTSFIEDLTLKSPPNETGKSDE